MCFEKNFFFFEKDSKTEFELWENATVAYGCLLWLRLREECHESFLALQTLWLAALK